jgi:hypothetical protein
MDGSGEDFRAEVRGRRSEVRGRRSEVGGRRSEVGVQKLKQNNLARMMRTLSKQLTADKAPVMINSDF